MSTMGVFSTLFCVCKLIHNCTLYHAYLSFNIMGREVWRGFPLAVDLYQLLWPSRHKPPPECG